MDAPLAFPLLCALIGVALLFDLLNGLHDAANSIATIVSTRVLSPTQAVAWAAFFNFVAAFVFGTKVSETISTGLVDPKVEQAKRMAVAEPPVWMPETVQAERPSVAELVLPSERAVAEPPV